MYTVHMSRASWDNALISSKTNCATWFRQLRPIYLNHLFVLFPRRQVPFSTCCSPVSFYNSNEPMWGLQTHEDLTVDVLKGREHMATVEFDLMFQLCIAMYAWEMSESTYDTTPTVFPPTRHMDDIGAFLDQNPEDVWVLQGKNPKEIEENFFRNAEIYKKKFPETR